MSSYNPPTEDLPIFNSLLFNQPEETLSQAEADLLYLSKTKTDTSTAPQTTFNGGVNVVGNITGSSLIQSNTTTASTNSIYNNLFTGSTLTIGTNNSTNTINGTTTFPHRTIFGTDGVSTTPAIFRTDLRIFDIASPYTNLGQIYANSNTLYYGINGGATTASFHSFSAFNNANVSRQTFKVGYDAVEIIDGVNLNARQIVSTTPASASHTLFTNMTAGGVLTIGNSASTNTINGNTTMTNDLTISGNVTINGTSGLNVTPISTRNIFATTPSAGGNLFNNVTVGGLIGIGSVDSTNTIRGVSTFTQNLTCSGLLNATSIKSATPAGANVIFDNMTSGGTISFGSIFTNTTFSGQITPGSIYTRYIKSATVNSTNVIFDNMITGGNIVFGGALSTNSFFGASTFSQAVTFNTNISHNSSSYTFPFASATNQGYYLKTTGTATSVTTATPTSIVTTASIPVGVWRIDFSVQNVVGAAGAGTISSAQSYISNTLNGNIGTAVSFTGSIVRSHVSEVYANNDVQVITSSLTYQQSSAGVLYLNIVRSYATGTYSFTGEIAITRLS